MSRTDWTLMATHGVVLFYIAANPECTMRQMSEALGITERRIGQVVKDLSEAEMVQIVRLGRRNTYAVNPTSPFRHPTLSRVKLGDFLKILKEPAISGPK